MSDNTLQGVHGGGSEKAVEVSDAALEVLAQALWAFPWEETDEHWRQTYRERARKVVAEMRAADVPGAGPSSTGAGGGHHAGSSGEVRSEVDVDALLDYVLQSNADIGECGFIISRVTKLEEEREAALRECGRLREELAARLADRNRIAEQHNTACAAAAKVERERGELREELATAANDRDQALAEVEAAHKLAADAQAREALRVTELGQAREAVEVARAVRDSHLATADYLSVVLAAAQGLNEKNAATIRRLRRERRRLLAERGYLRTWGDRPVRIFDDMRPMAGPLQLYVWQGLP